MWKDIDSFFRTRKIISVREVYLEIKKGSDYLANWIESHKVCFIYPDEEQCITVQKLQEDYEYFVEKNKPGPHADPWIIACAVRYNLKIIQHEQLQNNKQKLPYIAKEKNLKYIKLPEFFELENLKY